MKTSVWNRIQSALSEAGLRSTQQAVADLCNIKQPSVNDWAKGKIPSRKHIFTIAVASNVTTEWLETGRGPKHPDAKRGSNLEAILSTLNSFDDQELAGLVDYVHFLKSEREKPAPASANDQE